MAATASPFRLCFSGPLSVGFSAVDGGYLPSVPTTELYRSQPWDSISI